MSSSMRHHEVLWVNIDISWVPGVSLFTLAIHSEGLRIPFPQETEGFFSINPPGHGEYLELMEHWD